MTGGQAALWAACDTVAEHRRGCEQCLTDWAAGLPVRCEVHARLEAERERRLTDWLWDPMRPEYV